MVRINLYLVRERRHAQRAGKPRATVFIEFAFVLPIFLFLILFAIDMGALILVKGAYENVTYAAARAGAQTGQPGTTSSGDSYDAFSSGAAEVNSFTGGNRAQPIGTAQGQAEFFIDGPAGNCTDADRYVKITSVYHAHFITPGLVEILGLVSGRTDGQSPGTFPIYQHAVSRCEVVRQ